MKCSLFWEVLLWHFVVTICCQIFGRLLLDLSSSQRIDLCGSLSPFCSIYAICLMVGDIIVSLKSFTKNKVSFWNSKLNMTKTYNLLYVATFCDHREIQIWKTHQKTIVLCEYSSTQEYIKRHTMQNYTLDRVLPEERCVYQHYSQSRRRLAPAPFTAYGSFRNCTRQNHGTAGNREAGGFVNST